jgi:HPt (histidine-containing phosphotransfer) domain-containing protein
MINEKEFLEKYVHFDKETVAEIIDIFLKEYQERIDRLTRSIEKRDLEELQKNAHAFRGTISNFDTHTKAWHEILQIEEEVKTVVQQIKQGQPLSQIEEKVFFDKIEKTFEDFKRDSRRLVSQLKEIRKHYTI